MKKRNKWLEEEIEILKNNYYMGSEYVSKLIRNHSKNSIKIKANNLKLIVDDFLLYNNLDYVKKIISESKSFAEMFRKMDRVGSGESYKVFRKAIEKYNIDIYHFVKKIILRILIKNLSKIF